MAVDFSNLDKFKVKTAETKGFPLSRIKIDGENCVVLMGHYAGISNNEWLTAVVNGAPNLRVFDEDEGMEERAYTARRENQLLAEHSITGWKHVVDANGELVPFSKEVCIEFLEWLDDEDATRIRLFFQNRLNFMSGADESAASELGNS